MCSTFYIIKYETNPIYHRTIPYVDQQIHSLVNVNKTVLVYPLA